MLFRSIYGIVFALGISGILFLDYYFNKKNPGTSQKQLFIGLSIVIVGVILSLIQIMPDKDNTWPGFYATELFDMIRWESIANRLFLAYFYIPNPTGINFWNTNIYFKDYPVMHLPIWNWYNEHPEYLWGWIYMPIISFLLGIIIFIRKPLIMLLYAGTTFGLLSVFYYTDLVHIRYTGYLLIVLVVCYWLAKYYPDSVYDNAFMRFLSTTGRLISIPFLTIVLVTNIIGGMVAYSKDINEKFTVSKDAADYIMENKLDTLTIVGSTDFTIASISAYVGKTIYYPQMADYGSYVIWNKKRKNDFTIPQLDSSINLLVNEGKTKLLLILTNAPQFSTDGKTNQRLVHGLFAKNIKADLIKSFEGGIVADEKFFIYIVQKIDPAKENLSQYTILY